MKTILSEFIGSMERIRNNFYFHFLALNFINQRPFQYDIILPVDLPQNIITAESLNSFNEDGVQEYGNSIRRHFLNDMVIVYERYSMLMHASHVNAQVRIDPCHINDKNLGAAKFEKIISNICSSDDLVFLLQLRRLRNSIVHYNGHYTKTNPLSYTFGTQKYDSKGNEGRAISIEFTNLLWIYERMLTTVNSCHGLYAEEHVKR